MLQGDSLAATVYVVIKALLAIGLWGMAAIGHLQCRLAWWERLLAFTAGTSLILALPVTDEVGFVLGALVLALHFWRARRAIPVAGA